MSELSRIRVQFLNAAGVLDQDRTTTYDIFAKEPEQVYLPAGLRIPCEQGPTLFYPWHRIYAVTEVLRDE